MPNVKFFSAPVSPVVSAFSLPRLLGHMFDQEIAFYQHNHFLEANHINEMRFERNPGTQSTPGEHYRIGCEFLHCLPELQNFFEKHGIPYERKTKENDLILVVRVADLDETTATSHDEGTFCFNLHKMFSAKQESIDRLREIRADIIDSLKYGIPASAEIFVYADRDLFAHMPVSLKIATHQPNKIIQDQLDKVGLKEGKDYFIYSYAGAEDQRPREYRITLNIAPHNKNQVIAFADNLKNDLAETFHHSLKFK